MRLEREWTRFTTVTDAWFGSRDANMCFSFYSIPCIRYDPGIDVLPPETTKVQLGNNCHKSNPVNALINYSLKIIQPIEFFRSRLS
jgi:hypothetical protein